MTAKFIVNCSHCGVAIRVRGEHSGKLAKCPACKESFIVALAPTAESGPTILKTAVKIPETAMETLAISASDQPSTPHDSKAPETQSPSAGSGSSSQQPKSPKTIVAEPSIGMLGRFELRKILGQGAFGRVYLAHDPQLDRLVALKVPTFDVNDARRVQRFVKEAKAAARLRHPNIVPTYESGLIGGQYYIASQFITGKTLEEYLRDEQPDFRRAAEWVRQLADGLAYAHEQGIVHRDIKPANVMLDEREVPQIMDFGLAKRLNDDAAMTIDGTVMGTPAYMSPEQARGEMANVDSASDQYSLGIVLYELLTHRRPFDGPSHSVIASVLTKDPPQPRSINPQIPRDLDAICQMAINKAKGERYPSMKDFAQDLVRWLNDSPVRARRPTYAERFSRWRKREPRVAALLVVIVLVLLAGVAISSTFAVHANQESQRARTAEADAKVRAAEALSAQSAAEQAKIEAETAKTDAEKARGFAEAAKTNAEQAKKDAEAAEQRAVEAKEGVEKLLEREKAALADSRRMLVSMKTLQGLNAVQNRHYGEAVSWFADATAVAEQGSSEREESAQRFHAWQKRLARPIFARRDALPSHFEFSSDGKYLVTRWPSGTIEILSVPSCQPVNLPTALKSGLAVEWHPQRALIAILQAGKLVLHDVNSNRTVHERSVDNNARCLKFVPSGRELIVPGKQIRVLNIDKLEWWNVSWNVPSEPLAVSINPAGDRLATLHPNHLIQLRRLTAFADEKPLFETQQTRPQQLRAMTPQFVGKYLLVVESNGLVAVDSESGARAKDFPGSFGIIAPSRGGECTFIQTHFQVAHFHAPTLALQRNTSIGHNNSLQDMTLSADRQLLATAAIDSELHLWNHQAQTKHDLIAPHQDEVHQVQFSPRGTHLASVQRDGLLRIWELPASSSSSQTHRLQRDDYLTVSADGRYVAPGGFNITRGLRRVEVVDLQTGQKEVSADLPGYLNSTAFSPDAQLLAVAYSQAAKGGSQSWTEFSATWTRQPGFIAVRKRDTGDNLFEPVATTAEPICVAFNPAGDLLIAICANGNGLVLDSKTGVIRSRFQEGSAAIPANNIPLRIQFHPDGQRFLTYGFLQPATATLRKLPDGQPLLQFQEERVSDVAFSHDGKKVALASLEFKAVVRDCGTGELLHEQPLTHPGWVFRVRFSPDDQLLATASRDWNARIWDWKKGQIALSLPHPDEVDDLEWHPKKALMATAGRDGVARLWSTNSGRVLDSSGTFPNFEFEVSFALNNEALVFPSLGNEIQLLRWNDVETKAQATLEDELLQTRAEVYSGYRIVDHAITRLDSTAWLERWNKLKGEQPAGTGVDK